METVQPIRSKAQIEAMKRVLKGGSGGLRDYALFTTGINSGLRISDLLALRVGDIRDDKGKLRERVSLRESKTGKTKDFPLGLTARRALSEYLATRVDATTDEPLFPSRLGNPLSRGQAWHILSAAAKSVGIKERTGTHTLRKTFGFHAYSSGVDITLIQKLLNHGAPSITLTYIGITQDNLDDVYLSLEL